MAKKEETIKDPAGLDTVQPDPFDQFEKLANDSIMQNMDDAKMLFGKFNDRMKQYAERPDLWASAVSLIIKDAIRFIKEH